MHETGSIHGFHAHIYFATPEQKRVAMRIRDAIAETFPGAKLGRVHESPVGPHPEPMYQVAFSPELFARVMPWLMLHREGLSVLVHPLTGDPLPEHTEQAAWLGRTMKLNLDVFAELGNAPAQREGSTNRPAGR